ncbi:hypothetical protein NDA01_26875 [Trichocoleus desertorum AS-A10]|uniref:hypothetical protein n=1 Tax=Trichocoleus desertorum TaxID=1481672 RepID=UPI003296D505
MSAQGPTSGEAKEAYKLALFQAAEKASRIVEESLSSSETDTSEKSKKAEVKRALELLAIVEGGESVQSGDSLSSTTLSL